MHSENLVHFYYAVDFDVSFLITSPCQAKDSNSLSLVFVESVFFVAYLSFANQSYSLAIKFIIHHLLEINTEKQEFP